MQEMDFNRLMMMQEEEVRVQGTWIPGTPAKPTPIRPQPISNDRQVSQPGLPYWVNSVGNPTEFYQEIPQTVTSTGVMNSSFNSMGYVNQNRGNGNTLQTGMVGSDKGPDNIVDCLSSTISDWSDIGFAELLALSETASGAAAVLTSTGSNHAASNPRFPVSSSQINGNLQRPNPPVTNQFFSTNQNVLNNSNYSHHIPQTQISSPMPNSQINNNLQGSNPPIRNQYFSSNPYLVNNSNYPHLIHQSRSQTIPISSSQINGRPQASNQPVTNQKVSSNPNVVNNNLLNHIHQCPQRGNNAASGQRILISNSQIKSSPQGSNLPVHNQNISSSPSMANSSNYSQHMHQYGFPVSSNPMFDLNSSPRRFADAVSNGTISFQCSPVTPARDKKAQNHNAEIIIREEGSDSVKNKEQNAVNQSTENGTELPHGNSIIQSMDSSSVDVSTMLKENQNHNETKEPTMEQNKTPQQKPKRKKIRPRVVIEGKKPRKTPYSYTKQPHTKENQPAKRKYVRKNAVKTSETPSANVTKEINTDQVVEKSCKKVLFNLDDITIDVSGSNNTDYKEGLLNSIVDSSPSRLTFNGRSEPQAREICTGIKSTPATKSVVQMDQIEEIVVENSPVGLPFDLNCSSFKTLDDIISLPDRPAPTTLPPTRKEQPRENLNILTNNKNILAKTGSAVYQTESDNGKYGNAVRFRSPTNTGLVSQNNSEYVAASEQARGSKRGFCNAVDETSLSMNFIMKHWNILHANHQKFQGNQYQLSSSSVELQNPEAIKKRRTDIDQMAVNSSTPVEHFLEGAREAMACKANNMRANHFASLVKNRGLSPQLGNIIGAKERQSGVINSEPNVHPHVLENQQSCRLQSTFAGLTSQNQKPIWVTRDELQRSQTSMSCVQKEIITKNMSNGPSQISDLTSRSTTANCNPMPKTPLKVPPTAGARLRVENIPRQRDCTKDLTLLDNQVKKTRKRRNTLSSGNSVSQSSINNENLHKNGTLVYKDHQASAKSRGPLELPWQFKFSIDDIIHKLDHLSINDERKNLLMAEKSALVPFRGEAQMVPYEGMFNPIKKRQLRPKVNLDPETDRVWKLLMGIDSSDGVEGTNQDKEKWWEEERKVFRGRADSFIARMHLIQGDRRFTKWKGSVVDSVVGVFLTQNVSDHLSSSAFMSLVARFPHKSANNSRTCHKEQLAVLIEEPDGCVPDSDANINWHENVSKKQVCNQDFISICEVDLEEREKEHSNESFGSNLGGSLADISKGSQINFSEGTELYQQSLENGTETSTPGTRCETLVEVEERITLGGIVSSQQSTVSSQNSVELSKPEQAEGCITKCTSNSSSNPTFAELLQMGGKPTSQEYCSHGSGNFSIYLNSKSGHKQSECMEGEKKRVTTNGADGWKNSFPIYSSNSDFPLTDLCNTHSSSYLLHLAPDSGVQEVNCPEISGAKSGVSLPSNTSDITSIKDLNPIGQRVIQTVETVKPHESSTNTATASMASTYLPSNKYLEHSILNPAKEALLKHQGSSNNFLRAREEKVQHQCALVTEPKDLVGTQAGTGSRPHQVHAQKISSAETINAAKAKGKAEKEKKEFDWDSLRRDAYQKGFKGERNNSTMDSLDWEAVRSADVSELAKAIKERGMNNMLAERIKAFLDRLVKDHGSIDLEWLRDVPPDKAKEYLLSIRGLGLKSVECIRLLTLHHLAFPVDTNVGRIAIRLGWVPLQPLPESLQLHLLEMYPMLDTVQKYLWPRLCKLDQRTLYELHYQLITFGKVFCTKSKPNCNACPMRAECKHFASAFASARLALPGPEEKGIVTSSVPVTVNQNPAMGANPMPFPLLEEGLLWDARLRKNDCEPIIEEPMSPENEYTEIPESDIEDAYYECPNEIPSIDLNIEEFTLNLQNYMEENKIELQEGDVSKALVALTPQAASIPITKLKNVNRLRTEHQVYELPDSHPLLKEVPRREPDDHCSYLLAIWTPGETAESTQPPEICRGSQVAGYLCNEKTCFSCNSVREANSQIVRGTLLIPCRTAMRGSFPLNGTYFQVNEVFADHESSLNPIAVPRASIWNLPRRTVLFGTSVPSIFKGQTTQEIQSCFWKGYVCVRGFDQKSRAPRPLMARLHFPASRVVRNKTSTGNQ